MQLNLSPDEEWRPIVGWEGRYEVSNLGHVRNAFGRFVGRPVKPSTHKRGYLYVHLKRKPLRKARTIHSLVTEAFIGPYPEGTEVNHKDGDKTHNAVTNLEYVTHQRNIHHARVSGLLTEAMIPRRRGSTHHRAKLTETDVLTIRAAPSYFGSNAGLARQYHVTSSLIGQIRRGTSWSWLTQSQSSLEGRE